MLGDAVRKEIVNRVREAGFFVVMMDETMDSNHVDQVIVMIRIVSSSKGKIVIEERMLALVTPEGKKGEDMERALLATLEKFDLEITCYWSVLRWGLQYVCTVHGGAS